MQFRQRGTPKKPRPIETPQGRNTLISLLTCAILGMVLNWILPVVIEQLHPNMKPEDAQEMGLLIALGISGIVLVVSLLRPKKHISPLRRQLMKEQEKADGR